MKLKKWNGSAWVQDYPEVNVSSIVATGTPSSSTFLRGDGQWATPGGGERKFYNTISGTSGAWYDLFTVSDGATGALFVSIQTYAHDDLLFTVSTGYSGSFVNTITILNCVYNPSGPYASITGVRVTNTGLVQAQFTWSSGPTVDIDIAVYGSGTLPTLSASLTANATSYTIDDTVSITGLQGKIRSENGFVQGSTPIPSGTGTLNELTYWSGANTIGTLTTGTYPSLTELSYIKGLSSAVQTQLNARLDTSGSTQTKSGSLNISGSSTITGNISAGRYYQSANGSPTSNLGTPSVSEMALFDEQFDNKTAFANIARISAQTSTNGVTWTEFTLTDAQKRALVGGDAGTAINIPYNTTYFRFKFLPGGYVYANALYCYWSSQGHSTAVQIYKQHDSGSYTQHTSSTAQVGAWPGHLYLPFSTIPWLDGGTLGTHFDDIYIVFIPTWNATYSANSIQINKLQIWGGYPAGKRNIYTTDDSRNVAFPAALTGTRLFSTIANGTSPLSVTSTTVNTNLNSDLLDGYHETSFIRLAANSSNATNGNFAIGNASSRNFIQSHSGQPLDINPLGNAVTIGGTSNTAWHAGNDGTGSGLDADLLDGNHASAFLLTSTRGAANGVAPLDATSKVPVANLPDFITGAGRGFYLVGTISGAVSLSDASTGLVAQLVALSGGDYENMYGYMWTAAANVTLTWTDQTTLGPTFQYHVLTPGDEGDSTSPVTLEAGDMIVFTKYSDTAGDGNDQQFTFSVINSSDPRFANYLPLTGGTMTGTITSHRSDGQTHNTWALVSEPGNYYLDLNTVVTPSNVRWNFNQRNAGTNYNNVLVIDTGKIGIGTSSPGEKLSISSGNIKIYSLQNTADQYRYIGTEYDVANGNNKAEIRFAIDGADTRTRIQFHTANGVGNIDERMRITYQGNVGIGTTSPTHLIHIAGSNGILATFAGASSSVQIGADGNGGVIRPQSVDRLNFTQANGTNVMTINGANVGIGTTAPAVKLHVAGATRIVGQLNIMGDAETKRVWVDYEDGNDMGTIQAVQDGVSYKNLALQPDGNNVGIGTRSPSEKLEVNGVAKATSFTSTVALGTAPLTVTSSTKVNNLNADFLDGYDATSFMLASGMINYAPLASPALTGTPTAPTATAGTNTTQIATTAFVSTAVANLINSAPGALDTLDELAAALGDDASFATTVTNALAGKASTVHTHTKSDITDFGHSHGNISNTGTITSTTVTPGDQDRILIADNSASGSIERGIIIGTGTSTFLRNDGQWATPADTTTLTSLGLTATATELNYVDGVTSAIQTQIDGKAATSHTHTASQISDSGNVGRNLLTTSSATASTLFFKKNPDHTITLEDAATFRTSTGTAAASHTHSAADITSGTLVVGRGGTGTTTAPTAGGIIWATSTSAYASTALGTSGQFLQSAGTNTPTWQNLTTNITTISNLAPNTYSSSFSVTGYRWVIITGFKNSALTEVVFQTRVDLNDTNQYSTTARTRRIVWNNDTSTFGDDLTIQNSTGLRLQFAAGINFTYRLDGVR